MYQPNFYYILVKILTLLFIYILFYTWESFVFYNYENTVFRLHISLCNDYCDIRKINYLLTPKTVHTSFIRKMFANVNKTVRKKFQQLHISFDVSIKFSSFWYCSFLQKLHFDWIGALIFNLQCVLHIFWTWACDEGARQTGRPVKTGRWELERAAGGCHRQM